MALTAAITANTTTATPATGHAVFFDGNSSTLATGVTKSQHIPLWSVTLPNGVTEITSTDPRPGDTEDDSIGIETNFEGWAFALVLRDEGTYTVNLTILDTTTGDTSTANTNYVHTQPTMTTYTFGTGGSDYADLAAAVSAHGNTDNVIFLAEANDSSSWSGMGGDTQILDMAGYELDAARGNIGMGGDSIKENFTLRNAVFVNSGTAGGVNQKPFRVANNGNYQSFLIKDCSIKAGTNRLAAIVDETATARMMILNCDFSEMVERHVMGAFGGTLSESAHIMVGCSLGSSRTERPFRSQADTQVVAYNSFAAGTVSDAAKDFIRSQFCNEGMSVHHNHFSCSTREWNGLTVGLDADGSTPVQHIRVSQNYYDNSGTTGANFVNIANADGTIEDISIVANRFRTSSPPVTTPARSDDDGDLYLYNNTIIQTDNGSDAQFARYRYGGTLTQKGNLCILGHAGAGLDNSTKWVLTNNGLTGPAGSVFEDNVFPPQTRLFNSTSGEMYLTTNGAGVDIGYTVSAFDTAFPGNSFADLSTSDLSVVTPSGDAAVEYTTDFAYYDYYGNLRSVGDTVNAGAAAALSVSPPPSPGSSDFEWDTGYASSRVILSVGHCNAAKPGGGAPNEFAYPGGTATDETLCVYATGLNTSVYQTLEEGTGAQAVRSVSGVEHVDPFTLTSASGGVAFNKVAESLSGITENIEIQSVSHTVGRMVRGLSPLNGKRGVLIGGQSRSANAEHPEFVDSRFSGLTHSSDSYCEGFLLQLELRNQAGGRIFAAPPRDGIGASGRRTRGGRFDFNYLDDAPTAANAAWTQNTPTDIFGFARNRGDDATPSNSIPIVFTSGASANYSLYVTPDHPLQYCDRTNPLTVRYWFAGYPGSQNIDLIPETASDMAGTGATGVEDADTLVLDTSEQTYTVVAGTGTSSGSGVMVVSGDVTSDLPSLLVGDDESLNTLSTVWFTYNESTSQFGVIYSATYDGGNDETVIQVRWRDSDGVWGVNSRTFATGNTVHVGPCVPKPWSYTFDPVSAGVWRGIKASRSGGTGGPATLHNVDAYNPKIGYLIGTGGSGGETEEERINNFVPGAYPSGAKSYQHEMMRLAGVSAHIWPSSGNGTSIEDFVSQFHRAIPNGDAVIWADGNTPGVNGENSTDQTGYFIQTARSAKELGAGMVSTVDSPEVGTGPQQLTRGFPMEGQAHRSPYGNLVMAGEFFKAAIRTLSISAGVRARGRGRAR